VPAGHAPQFHALGRVRRKHQAQADLFPDCRFDRRSVATGSPAVGTGCVSIFYVTKFINRMFDIGQAGLVEQIWLYQADPVHTLRTCVYGAFNLELARRSGARILQTSTIEVYGDSAHAPTVRVLSRQRQYGGAALVL